MAELLDLIRGQDAAIEDHEITAKKSANLVLWVILGFFVCFLLWATFTRVDQTVRGMGRVVPSSKLQVVSNLEGGVIELRRREADAFRAARAAGSSSSIHW